MLTNDQIAALEAKGFNRWTKGNLDRLYINASQLGLVCSYYNTGNVCHAEFDGHHISNCEARRMKAAKTFIDVKSGRVYSDNPSLEEAAQELFDSIVGDTDEEYTPSATAGDYGPGNPWDAPGMRVSDFISGVRYN